MLHRLTALAWASLVSIVLLMSPSASAATLGALPGAASLFAGNAPELGVQEGQLSPCPDSPNCVVSQNADADHGIAPLSYSSDRDTARATLLKVLTVVPRTRVVEQTNDYIRFESSSRLLGFVDDGEFIFPPKTILSRCVPPPVLESPISALIADGWSKFASRSRT